SPKLVLFCLTLSSLPIGFVSVIVTAFALQVPRQSNPTGKTVWQRIQQLDLAGAAILIPAVVCLLLALQWGGSKYAWSNSRIIGLFIGFGLMAIIFIILQMRAGEQATIPLRFFKQRSVAAAVTLAFFFGAGFFV